MKIKHNLSFLLTFAFGFCLSSSAGPSPSPLEGKVSNRLNSFVQDRAISGAVGLVAKEGQIVYHDAVGLKDLEKGEKMKKDTLFWIASMTKPITATAIMILSDRKKLSIDDPVEKYLPEFKNPWMIASKSDEQITSIRAPRAITIRDLLTHTSGLNDLQAPRPNSTLGELVIGYSQLPLRFPPGSKWEYCNSGINTLGRIVEVISGMPFDRFLEKEIFTPLGMKDTTFFPSPAQLKRLAKSYQPKPNAIGLEPVNIFLFNNNIDNRDRAPSPAGGLFSTAHDIFLFYQMLLDGGVGKDKTILSLPSVEEMVKTQTGELKTGFTDGMSFGLGFAVVKTPTGVTRHFSPGTFGHGGAYGTQSWADRNKRTIVILMIQRAKLPNADGSVIRDGFQSEVFSIWGSN